MTHNSSRSTGQITCFYFQMYLRMSENVRTKRGNLLKRRSFDVFSPEVSICTDGENFWFCAMLRLCGKCSREKELIEWRSIRKQEVRRKAAAVSIRLRRSSKEKYKSAISATSSSGFTPAAFQRFKGIFCNKKQKKTKSNLMLCLRNTEASSPTFQQK